MTDLNTRPESSGTSETASESVEQSAFEAGRAAASNRWIMLAVGAVSLVAGFFAIAMPFLGSIAAALVAGWVLLLVGVVGLVTAFRRNHGWQLAAAFVLALITVLAGILMLLQPLAGIFALTTLIIAYFGAAGAMRIYLGARNFGDGGGWMVAVGVLSVLLALLLWFGLPYNIVWVPGVLLGIDLLFWGALMIAFAARIGRPAERHESRA